jgi:hypothetical protein
VVQTPFKLTFLANPEILLLIQPLKMAVAALTKCPWVSPPTALAQLTQHWLPSCVRQMDLGDVANVVPALFRSAIMSVLQALISAVLLVEQRTLFGGEPH